MVFELAVLLALFAANSEAPAPCFANEAAFEAWLGAYYRAPAPDKLPCSLVYYADSTLYSRFPTRMPVAHFHAALLDDEALDALFTTLTAGRSERAQVMGLHVFWLAGTDHGRALLHRARAEWLSVEVQRVATAMVTQAPVDVLAQPVTNPAAIDVLWAQFYATGSELAVRQVADALQLLKVESRALSLVGDAARQSLVLNTHLHPRVREILTGVRAEADDGTAKLLAEILSSDPNN
jgi:hypothetical protein